MSEVMERASMRPSGLAPVTLAMCILNLTGVAFAYGTEVPPAMVMPILILVMLVSYLALWYFWKGRNWARWLVLVTSGVALLNLLGLPTFTDFQKVVVVIEAALGGFLLYWLNTRAVREFFRSRPVSNQ